MQRDERTPRQSATVVAVQRVGPSIASFFTNLIPLFAALL
jgi:hypothetical protein